MFSFRRVAQQSAAVFRGVSAAQWPGAVVQPAALKTCTPACAREYSDFGDGAGGSGGDQGLDRPWMKTSRNDNNETQSVRTHVRMRVRAHIYIAIQAQKIPESSCSRLAAEQWQNRVQYWH